MRSNRMDKPAMNAAFFQGLADSEGALQGPVNLTPDQATPLLLTPLVWSNWGNVGQLKITNTGHTAVVSGHWRNGRPSVSGGPFAVPYLLGQIHFHWGPTNAVGSEHTLNGRRFPLEMHVLLYKSSYERPKIALRERDGVAVLAYLFEIQNSPNDQLQPILEGVNNILRANQSASLSPDALRVVQPLTEEYFLYWGSLMTDHCAHVLSWLVCPQALHVSSAQVGEFRKMLNQERKYIKKNYCDIQPLLGRKIFLATTDSSQDAQGGGRCCVEESVSLTPPVGHRCCLSARKRVKSRRNRKSVKDMMTSLNCLEKQTNRKIKELEALSKELVTRDLAEAEAWFEGIERRVRNLELTAVLGSRQGKITHENFERWRLKQALFRELPTMPVASSRREQEISNKPQASSRKGQGVPNKPQVSTRRGQGTPSKAQISSRRHPEVSYKRQASSRRGEQYKPLASSRRAELSKAPPSSRRGKEDASSGVRAKKGLPFVKEAADTNETWYVKNPKFCEMSCSDSVDIPKDKNTETHRQAQVIIKKLEETDGSSDLSRTLNLSLTPDHSDAETPDEAQVEKLKAVIKAAAPNAPNKTNFINRNKSMAGSYKKRSLPYDANIARIDISSTRRGGGDGRPCKTARGSESSNSSERRSNRAKALAKQRILDAIINNVK